MNIHYVYTKLKYNGRDTLIIARAMHNWFERKILGKKNYQLNYIGHGTKWTERDANWSHHPVSEEVAKKLQSIEYGVLHDYGSAALKGRQPTITKAFK